MKNLFSITTIFLILLNLTNCTKDDQPTNQPTNQKGNLKQYWVAD